MKRRTLLILVPGLLLLLSRPCLGGSCPPDAGQSRVPGSVAVSPDGGLAYEVTVIGACGPIAGSAVEVRFNTFGDRHVCWCATVPGPGPRTFTALTNTIGVATFRIAGGGCLDPARIPGPDSFAAEVYADGVRLRGCGVISPDAYDSDGRNGTDSPPWDPVGACATGLSDVVKATPYLQTAEYDFCTDMNQDMLVGIADAVILSAYYNESTLCTGDTGP